MIRAILVDDEINSLENLYHKINEFCPNVEVVAQTQSPITAIDLLNLHKPDLLFLDIEMPKMNGFRMLEKLANYNFEIIFTTAYNHYAIDAIRISAFDYLTKPIAIKDLQDVLDRFKVNKLDKTKEKLEVLTTAIEGSKNQKEKIAIATADGIALVKIENLVYLESNSNYTKLYFADGKNIVASKTLGDFETMLTGYGFFRIHHSYLININNVVKYLKGDGGQVLLSNNTTLDVSRRKKDEFLNILMQV
jgi:two-component system, LytTR family, response regulator